MSKYILKQCSQTLPISTPIAASLDSAQIIFVTINAIPFSTEKNQKFFWSMIARTGKSKKTSLNQDGYILTMGHKVGRASRDLGDTAKGHPQPEGAGEMSQNLNIRAAACGGTCLRSQHLPGQSWRISSLSLAGTP